jgi:hypothetical protein
MLSIAHGGTTTSLALVPFPKRPFQTFGINRMPYAEQAQATLIEGLVLSYWLKGLSAARTRMPAQRPKETTPSPSDYSVGGFKCSHSGFGSSTPCFSWGPCGPSEAERGCEQKLLQDQQEAQVHAHFQKRAASWEADSKGRRWTRKGGPCPA